MVHLLWFHTKHLNQVDRVNWPLIHQSNFAGMQTIRHLVGVPDPGFVDNPDFVVEVTEEEET